MEKRVLEIPWITLWRIFFFVLIVTVMYLGEQVLLGLFLAIVISSGLEFMVNFLEKMGLPRALGVILIFLSGALIFIVTVYTVIPLILIDLNNVVSSLNKLGGHPWWGPFVSLKTTQSVGALINKISAEFLSGNSTPLGAFSDIVGNILLAVSVLVSSFYLSLTRDGVERFVKAVSPADYEDEALQLYDRARKKIGLWFRSQLFLSFIMGSLVVIALLVLGVKYAFLLGLVAGILELVPFVGPILSGSIAVISALTTSPTLAIYTLVVFLVIHQLESHVLVPILIGRTVGLHPVVVIVALLVGAEIGGFLGILISVPAAVVFQELLEGWSGRSRPREVAIG